MEQDRGAIALARRDVMQPHAGLDIGHTVDEGGLCFSCHECAHCGVQGSGQHMVQRDAPDKYFCDSDVSATLQRLK